MEAELTALAVSGATTLVGLMVSESWTQARDRVARFFARGGEQGSAEEELVRSQQALMAARAAQDDLAGADIEAEWRMRLRRVLQDDPQAADELRTLLSEVSPGVQDDRGASVHNSVSGGVQNGPVVQGQHFSGLTFGAPGRVPPEQRTGGQ
ncbi:hypothetical protein ACFV4X_16070 [Streptomyces ardesiacus]|uniref:hypothetical protein n=1 Tax=Streptomyces ardesiacus TaxID=285564 RepID=UPI003657C827